jgi:hypothetical protein
MSAPFEILPAVATYAPRRRPDNRLPETRALPMPGPLPRPMVPLTPLAGAVPNFRPVIGMPPIMPKGHLNSLAYIG